MADDLEECNKLIWSSLENFYSETKKVYYNNSVMNMDSMKREDMSEIFDLLSEEIELLIPKIDDLEANHADSFDKEHSYEVISWRSFRIMELVFLLSELEGRRVKRLENEIDADDFEHYCKEYFGLFKETVYYFH